MDNDLILLQEVNLYARFLILIMRISREGIIMANTNAGTKDERIHIRTTQMNKEKFQALADIYTGGNKNKLFDKIIAEMPDPRGEEHE